MKVLSMMKKAALGVCAVVLGACCWNIATAKEAPLQDNYIEAKAETTVSTSIDYRGSYDGSAHMNYFYLQFAGFTTQDDYEGNANSDYVFQNILLNGKSLYEINNTTDTTGWVWDTFPQNADSKWCKPVLGYIKDTKGRIQLRIHNNYTEALYAESGSVILTICEGFTLNDYAIDKETSYRFVKDSNATYGITVKNAKESTPTMDW